MVEGLIMPPQGNGVRVMSMLSFKPGGIEQPVAFRGPMLHRALEQFLTDVWWGDLDFLLLDLPCWDLWYLDLILKKRMKIYLKTLL